MLRILLTPRWIALHAVTVAVVVGFVALGWWQLDVYRDSESRQDLRDRPGVPVSDLVEPDGDLGAGADRAVVATGSYLRGSALTVPARVRDGILGSYVVAALRTSDGGTLTVLRGWVDDRDDPSGAAPGGAVTVTGHLLSPETAADATVSDSDLSAGEIGFVAPDSVAVAAGLAGNGFYPGYLLLDDEEPRPAASPESLDVDVIDPIGDVSPWQNLSYWAQWWVFAGAAVVFWVSFVRAATRRRSQTLTDAAARDEVRSA
ncbi:MAG: SURF1 family protein [Jiangellaceae bacterium]